MKFQLADTDKIEVEAGRLRAWTEVLCIARGEGYYYKIENNRIWRRK